MKLNAGIDLSIVKLIIQVDITLCNIVIATVLKISNITKNVASTNVARAYDKH